MTSDTTSFTSLQTDDHTGWPGADGRDITFFTATNALRYNRWQLLNHLDALTRSIDTALRGLGAGFPAVVTWYWDQHTNFTDPAILHGVDRVSDSDVPSTGPERHYALDTFERIRDLLGLDDQRMAALARISRNTPRDWRHGNRPKGATTRRLYELALVIDVVATQEPDLVAWARSMAPVGVSWSELADQDDGPASILGYYRHALFTPRPPVGLELGDEEDTLAASAAPVAGIVERKPGGRRQPR
jgi:hypothetical protein